jgi:uncharacterized protein YhbP (UPF0306 family)
VGIERSRRPVAASRITSGARRLLDASTLCAIATVAARGRAHINTAYFAWTPELEIVWLSEPRAKHSRNIRANNSVAVTVYDSRQRWGQPDRGIQLFGTAREVERSAAGAFEAVYAARFPAYKRSDPPAYRFYVLRPLRLKLFDENELGSGVFVTARVARDGRTAWERTDVYRPDV